MYKIFIVSSILIVIFDIKTVITKPISMDQPQLDPDKEDHKLRVEPLISVNGINGIKLKIESNQEKTNENTIKSSLKSVDFSSSVQEVSDLSPYQNVDTKKHFHLLKILDYYDFLPWYFSENLRRGDDRHLQFEIDDLDDPSKSDVIKTLAKRNIDFVKKSREQNNSSSDLSSEGNSKGIIRALEDNRDVLQYYFVKRDIHNFQDDEKNKHQGLRARRDLGDFSPEKFFSADSDDPSNNNYRYIAYVPFFKVKKYYIERKRLDLGL